MQYLRSWWMVSGWLIRQIGDHIEEFYRNLYSKPFPFRPMIEGVDFECIDVETQG